MKAVECLVLTPDLVGKAKKPGYDRLTGLALGDSGTWQHSNAGYRYLTSSITQKKFAAGGNTGSPVRYDINKNAPFSRIDTRSGEAVFDKRDKTIGYVESITSAPGDMLQGTWQMQSDRRTIDMFTEGVLISYIHVQ